IGLTDMQQSTPVNACAVVDRVDIIESALKLKIINFSFWNPFWEEISWVKI
ncbi:hypothetical protein ACJX0J_012937, partial [Zea mays]